MKSKLAVTCLTISAFFAFAVPANASQSLYFATGNDATNAEAMAFSLSADGTPAPLQTFTGTAGGYFNAVSMSPDGKFLFMADYNANEVRSLVVAPDGTLSDAPGSPLNLAPGSGPYGSAVTPDGKFAVFGMYDGHGVQAFSIGENGSLTPAPGGLVELDPSAYPYGVAISTDSRTLYVPDSGTDSLFVLRIEAGGTLTELPGSTLTGITNAYHAAVTPDGKFLYVPNYNEDLGVYGFSLDSEGLPTPLPGSPFLVMTDVYGGFEMSPDGKTLYSSGSSNEIQSASIAPDGSLTTGPSIMVGDYNSGLALNPAGTRLYNGMGDTPTGDRLDTFSVSETGALTAFGLPLSLPDTVSPDSDSMVVTPAQPPVAALTVSASKRTATFDASGSTDPDGTIASYAWDFGDGQTATTTTPTTTHNYASDGNFEATVTVTDADNCSTGLVFTGRTPYCNGSDVARAGATVSVDGAVKGARISAKKVQKQRGKKLVIRVKAGAREAVRIQVTGNARLKKLKGKVALKKVTVRTGADKYRTVSLRAKSKKRGRAAVGRKGKATITARFTDSLGNSTTRKITVRLK